jgi:hypothetical protein
MASIQQRTSTGYTISLGSNMSPGLVVQSLTIWQRYLYRISRCPDTPGCTSLKVLLTKLATHLSREGREIIEKSGTRLGCITSDGDTPIDSPSILRVSRICDVSTGHHFRTSQKLLWDVSSLIPLNKQSENVDCSVCVAVPHHTMASVVITPSHTVGPNARFSVQWPIKIKTYHGLAAHTAQFAGTKLVLVLDCICLPKLPSHDCRWRWPAAFESQSHGRIAVDS